MSQPGSSAGASPLRSASPDRGAASLTAGEALARIVAFGAALVVARRLGPAGYGVVGVASGILLYLQQLVDQGVELAGVPEVVRRAGALDGLASAAVTFRVIAGVGLALATLGVSSLFLPTPDGPVLAAYASGLVLTGASTRWILLGTGRPGVVAVARVVGELAALVATVLLVAGAADLLRVPAIAVGGLAVTTLLMLVGTRTAGVRLAPSLRWAECRELLHRGRALVVFTLLGLVLFNFDLVFLRVVRGEGEAGLYVAAYAFISFASNLFVAFAHATIAPLAARPVGAERRALFGRGAAVLVAVSLPAALGAAVVAEPLVSLVFGTPFAGAGAALRLLALTLPIAALRELAVAGVVAGGGERGLVRVNAITVIANVILVFVLVPWLGLRGAALATLATEGLRLALAAHRSGAAGFPLPGVGRYLRPGMAAVGMLAALRVVGPTPLWQAVLAGVVSYGGVLAAVGGIRLRRGGAPELSP